MRYYSPIKIMKMVKDSNELPVHTVIKHQQLKNQLPYHSVITIEQDVVAELRSGGSGGDVACRPYHPSLCHLRIMRSVKLRSREKRCWWYLLLCDSLLYHPLQQNG